MTITKDIKEIISSKDLMEPFSGKQILITGATGLIGSMLIRSLYYASKEYELNINIIGHTRSEIKAKKVLGDITENIYMIYSNTIDIRNSCDYIIHTACPTSSQYFVEKPVETIDSLLNGTKTMLELARKKKSTFIYISSMEEYGIPYISGDIMTEDKVGVIDHLTARSCYPEGKRMCECMCAAYASEYGVDAKIIRLAQTFGAGIQMNDKRLPMQIAKCVLEKQDIVLHTEGESISNFCYLTDAIQGILIVAIKGIRGEAYNICNESETRSIYEIAMLVSRELAEEEINVVKDVSTGKNFKYAPANTMRMSSEKIKKLGWRPRVEMIEGYKRLISYIREYGI